MDKKSITNKITFKLFEEFTADQAKIPGYIEQLKAILAELNKRSKLTTTSVDGRNFIDLGDWEIDGGELWLTSEDDGATTSEMWLNHPSDQSSFVITFEWWHELAHEEFSEISGPYSEHELKMNIEDIYHYAEDGSIETAIPLTKENEKLAEDIILQRNKNGY